MAICLATANFAFGAQSDEGGYINEADAHAGLESLGSRVTRFDLPKPNTSPRIEDPLRSPRILPVTSDDEEIEEIPPTFRQITAQETADTPQGDSKVPPPRRVEVQLTNMRPKTMTEFAETLRQMDKTSSIASGSDSDLNSIPAVGERESAKQAPITGSSSRVPRHRRLAATKVSSKKRRLDTSISITSGGDDDYETSSTPGRRSTRPKRSVPTSQAPKSDRVLRARPGRQSLRE